MKAALAQKLSEIKQKKAKIRAQTDVESAYGL